MSIDALKFVRKHGVVLESAKGSISNLAEAVVGKPIRGSWWKHPDSQKIFRATRLVRESEHVVVCRLVEGKITYVDRRLWPAMVRLAGYFKKESLAAIREEHTASGDHHINTVPFPKWVPLTARDRAKDLSEAKAAAQLGSWAKALMLHHTLSSSRKSR